ncbi:hypothetical protein GCM10028778_12020 [Barrientosiimonas marina]|uniref:SH3 domain-containing protein n=1 Tax=Lentibacillus kimchii TaxID=1542911 RepID=A0ABW2UX46_9BACI
MQNLDKTKTGVIVLMAVMLLLVMPRVTLAFSNPYTDMNASNAHFEAIMELTQEGIINGYPNETFRPNKHLSRQQAAKLFYDALWSGRRTMASQDFSFYEDIDADHRYAFEIAAVTPAIFKGEQDYFNPYNEMTREQMATTIVRAFNFEDDGTDPAINLSTVSSSHRKNVKILAQNDITSLKGDFRSYEAVTRGQFATFLHRSMVNKGMLETPDSDSEPNPPEEEPDPPEADKPEPDPPQQGENSYTVTSYNSSFSEAMDHQRSPKLDGAGQFTASRALTAYYANPNNFSKESPAFFQFLQLSHDPDLKASHINQQILADTGSLQGTADAFIKAGEQYDINAIYLIAHALHETGNGQSSLAGGLQAGLDESGHPQYVTAGNKDSLTAIKTVYNMFGIGAYDNCPKKCGAKRAYQEGWFSPEKAIVGGAQFINNGYISGGQNTLYKMRWNPDQPGSHQYATHVQWAVIQAREMMKMYQEAGLLDNMSLTFDVPEYQNHPDASSKPVGEAQYALNESEKGETYVTTSDLNMRTYPWGDIAAILANETQVNVIGENGGWYKVKANGQTGWVSSDYLEEPEPGKTDPEQPEADSNKLEVVGILTTLNVRPEPNRNKKPIGSLQNGDTVKGLLNDKGDLIQRNDYYKIKYNSQTGWAHKDYLTET